MPVYVGVDVDDGDDQDELDEVADEAPCSEDELSVAYNFSEVLTLAIELEVVLGLGLLYVCHSLFIWKGKAYLLT